MALGVQVMSNLFEKFLNSLDVTNEEDHFLAERLEQFKKETTEHVVKDFEIKINIAVYSIKGEFIKQCDSSTFSDKTIMLIMDNIEKELKDRG